MKKFDVFIIGSGSAGQTAAFALSEEGLSVGLADERPFGGTCALRGCQPKKYLVVPAHAAAEGAGLVERGFTAAPELDWRVMQQSRASFTDPVPEGTRKSLADKGVAVFDGHCAFKSGHEIECGGGTVSAEYVLIATGARPRPLPIKGGELTRTSDDFLYAPHLPKRVVFIGGGYISLEFASVAAAVGSEVTILQQDDRIMASFDAEMMGVMRDGCLSRGITVRTSVNPASVSGSEDSGFQVGLDDGEVIEADVVFSAIGRIPNTDGMNLEGIGVKKNPRGIETDGFMRTSVSHIFAAGDCIAAIQLAPVSDAEARIAARNITALAAGKGEASLEAIDRRVIPTVVFTYPQLASVGVEEDEAWKEHGDVKVIRGSGAGWPSYRRLNESHVAHKVILDPSGGMILGAHLVGPYAGEIINLFATAMKWKIPAYELKELPFAYPTYTSDIKYMLS